MHTAFERFSLFGSHILVALSGYTHKFKVVEDDYGNKCSRQRRYVQKAKLNNELKEPQKRLADTYFELVKNHQWLFASALKCAAYPNSYISLKSEGPFRLVIPSSILKTMKLKSIGLLVFLLVTLLFMGRNLSYAQPAPTGPNSTNYISVATNSVVSKSYITTLDLETAHTFPSALTIQTNSKSYGCKVFARISSYSGPPGYVPTSFPVALLFVLSTGLHVTSQLITSPITLTSTDQQLFAATKHTQFDYVYTVILNPFGYSYTPGIYSYTISFTMTQP